MITFTKPKSLVKNPLFEDQKKYTLSAFDLNTIDYPIQKVIAKLNEIPYCFTLQSCYGHFLYGDQTDPFNLVPLPETKFLENIKYRIAYIAMCVTNDKYGRNILTGLKNIEKIDPEYINGYRDLAISLIRYGELAEAHKNFLKALDLAHEIKKDQEIIKDVTKVLEEMEVGKREKKRWLDYPKYLLNPNQPEMEQVA